MKNLNYNAMALQHRTMMNSRQRELQNGVYPYNTILSMTEEQIQTQIKIREALRAGKKNQEFAYN